MFHAIETLSISEGIVLSVWRARMNALTLSQFQNCLLDQRYRLIRRLGTGSTGSVYLAIHVYLDVPVVLKCLDFDHVASPDRQMYFHAHFTQEARRLTTLRHAHIPRVLDYFIQDDTGYLVMDYIKGQTLAAYLHDHGPLPPAQAIAVARQLLAVLAYLRAQTPPIVYRALKPSKIMLTPDGRLFLLDWGIARQMATGRPDSLTLQGRNGVPMDTRADLFSLGALLYELVTGRKPLRSPGARLPARLLNPQVPWELDLLLERALQPAPVDRFQSAAEFQQALLHVQARLAGPLPGDPPPTRMLPEGATSANGERSAPWAHATDAPSRLGILAGVSAALVTMAALSGLVGFLAFASGPYPIAGTPSDPVPRTHTSHVVGAVQSQQPATTAASEDNSATDPALPTLSIGRPTAHPTVIATARPHVKLTATARLHTTTTTPPAPPTHSVVRRLPDPVWDYWQNRRPVPPPRRVKQSPVKHLAPAASPGEVKRHSATALPLPAKHQPPAPVKRAGRRQDSRPHGHRR
jgi:serine/threonine protein kinase